MLTAKARIITLNRIQTAPKKAVFLYKITKRYAEMHGAFYLPETGSRR